jgi:hypothetical protein
MMFGEPMLLVAVMTPHHPLEWDCFSVKSGILPPPDELMKAPHQTGDGEHVDQHRMPLTQKSHGRHQ